MSKRFNSAFLGALLYCAQTAFACNCLPPENPSAAFKSADAIFEGKVTRVKNIWHSNNQVTFDVTRYWKGDIRSVTSITTPDNEGRCGYPFQEQISYVVYTHHPSDQDGDTALETNECSRTTWSASAKADFAALGPGKIPPAQRQFPLVLILGTIVLIFLRLALRIRRRANRKTIQQNGR